MYSKCADDLKNGNVQAVTTDNVILTGLVAGSPDDFELVGNPFTKEPYGIGLKKGDDGVPQLHQRRARGVLRGRHLGRGLGPHRR